MPLEAGDNPEAIAHNLKEMIASGHPKKQAVAAALHTAKDTIYRDLHTWTVAQLKEEIAAVRYDIQVESDEAGKLDRQILKELLAELGKRGGRDQDVQEILPAYEEPTGDANEEAQRLEEKAKYFEKTDPDKARQLRARAKALKEKSGDALDVIAQMRDTGIFLERDKVSDALARMGDAIKNDDPPIVRAEGPRERGIKIPPPKDPKEREEWERGVAARRASGKGMFVGDAMTGDAVTQFVDALAQMCDAVGIDASEKGWPLSSKFTVKKAGKVIRSGISGPDAARLLELTEDIFESSIVRKGKAWNEDLVATEE